MQVGIWKYYYLDGQLSEKGEYIAGVREGKWNTFFATGEILSEGLYINDVEDSIWRYFNEKGFVTEQELWKQGKMTNAKQFFYKRKGKLKGELGMFGNNSLNYVKYHDLKRKKIAVKGVMKDGLPQSSWRFYNKKGDKTIEGNFDNGLRNGKWKFYQNEKLTSEGSYLQGQKFGEWKYYNSKEKVERTEIYE